MKTTEMIKSLVGGRYRYMGNEYELMRVEPTVVMQNVYYGTCVELMPDTFKKHLTNGSIKQIKETDKAISQ